MASHIENQGAKSAIASRQRIRALHILAAFCVALVAGIIAGKVIVQQFEDSDAAAQVSALAEYRPKAVTHLYADDGKTVIAEFAIENRIPVAYEQIPPVMRNAILAIEDARFFDHPGVDPIRIIGAAYKDILTGSREGGSTLTQQVAKNIFLSRKQTFSRKISEALLALEIERHYSKPQIFTMYANQIFLGASAYGVESGAQTYFGKSVTELTIDEAALLAGIPKAPSHYSPVVNPEEARVRRNLVIDQMEKNDFITSSEAETAKSRPIKILASAYYPPDFRSSVADYPVEEIRKYLEEKYTTGVAQGGLEVYTTINLAAQREAVRAVQEGLRHYDETHAQWHSNYTNILSSVSEGEVAKTLRTFKHPRWFDDQYDKGDYVPGLITEIDGKLGAAKVRFGTYEARVSASDMGRCPKKPADEFKVGDIAEFKINRVDKTNRSLGVTLSQIPGIQGAMINLNAHNGEIAALVGGYDFTFSKFDNATQAYRQTGSAFKPFIYTAAVEFGYSPDSTISGAPILMDDGFTRWQPRNYDGSTSSGDVPMKIALAKSLNVQAVHVLQDLGIPTGAQMVRRFGITVPMAPYLPSALGATEVPLIEMVSAYSAFPNNGMRANPHLIRRVETADGRVLEEANTPASRVTSKYVAQTMTEMLQGVVQFGTGVDAKALGVPLAGKTGTVNNHTDVWFIGFTPTYVTGVWMGYPESKKPLGNDMTGAHGALPIFVSFMKSFLKDKPREDFEKPPEMPEDMKLLAEDRERQKEMQVESANMQLDNLPVEDSYTEPILFGSKDNPSQDGSAETNPATRNVDLTPVVVDSPVFDKPIEDPAEKNPGAEEVPPVAAPKQTPPLVPRRDAQPSPTQKASPSPVNTAPSASPLLDSP